MGSQVHFGGQRGPVPAQAGRAMPWLGSIPQSVTQVTPGIFSFRPCFRDDDDYEEGEQDGMITVTI